LVEVGAGVGAGAVAVIVTVAAVTADGGAGMAAVTVAAVTVAAAEKGLITTITLLSIASTVYLTLWTFYPSGPQLLQLLENCL